MISQKKRPPAFFANLRDTLHLMVTSFKLSQNSTNSDKETLENIERTLELHAYETADLIHQYYLERLKDQQNMEDCPYGELTVRCNFVNNKLEVCFHVENQLLSPEKLTKTHKYFILEH